MASINNGIKKITITPHKEEEQFFNNIDSASVFVPEWYKKSPQNIIGSSSELMFENPLGTTSTYKKCSPFLDSITSGYMVYLTSDIEIARDSNNNPSILWRSPVRKLITTHSNNQWEGLYYPDDCYNMLFKWENGHVYQTPEGYSTLFTHPLNRFDLPFYTLSGVVDTDKFNLAIHFPFFLKKDFVGVIPEGTPIAQLNMIKRENWSRKFNSYNKTQSLINSENFLVKIKRSYKNQFWQKKVYK